MTGELIVNNFDFVQETEKLIKELSARYNVDENYYDVCVNAEQKHFKDHPEDNGYCGFDISKGKPLIGLNPNLLTTLEELTSTFYHEFRHVWQRKNAAESDIGHWVGWREKNQEKFGKDAYFFSPAELDAYRFSHSKGKLDDFFVYEHCIPRETVDEEIRQNQLFAAETLRSEGFEVLHNGTIRRLDELLLLTLKEHMRYSKATNRNNQLRYVKHR